MPDIHGTEKAFEVLREALRSMEKVEDQSTDTSKLTKALNLHTEGEILWRNRDYKKALESLQLSLTFSEELLKEHTDLARCYNAIGIVTPALTSQWKHLSSMKKPTTCKRNWLALSIMLICQCTSTKLAQHMRVSKSMTRQLNITEMH